MMRLKYSWVCKDQRGNVLFLILIAVVLFAALSYAVTQSSRSGSDNNSEVYKLQAGQLLQYGALLQNTMQKLVLVKGCEYTELSFAADWDGDGTVRNDSSSDQANTTSPSDGSCHFFNSNGGGLPFIEAHSFVDGQIENVGYRLSGEYGCFGAWCR